jgi:hypothetical protein
VEPLPHRRLETNWLADPTHGGLLVAVTGSLDDVDLLVCTRMMHHSTTALAVSLDVDSWLGEGSRGSAAGALASRGWRAATLGPRDRLDQVWQDLGSSVSRAGRVAADTRERVR